FFSGAIALLAPIAWPEPFGLVLIEAMACGTPVIAFNRGSVPEIVEDGLTGFVVESKEGGYRCHRPAISALSRRHSAPLRRAVHGAADGPRISQRLSQSYRETAISTVVTAEDGRRWRGRRVSRASGSKPC